jgi:autotransporter strand-loop-strand O-heptosyltransferase
MKTKITLKSRPLGDTIVFMSVADKYQKDRGEDVYIDINPSYHFLFTNCYPNLKLYNHPSEFDKTMEVEFLFDPYTPMQTMFAKQMGYNAQEWVYQRPKVYTPSSTPLVNGKYIMIGIHSTSQLKYWNHSGGRNVQSKSLNWEYLTQMLKKKGYTVICCEKFENFGKPPFLNGLPKSSNNKTERELMEVMNYIQHCQFFIGLSSGLTWLAHAMNKRVVMISNFTEDYNEIDLGCEDYIRISNPDVCHGCFNAIGDKFTFDTNDWYWCPMYKGTPKEFECHKSITPKEVFDIISEEKWI